MASVTRHGRLIIIRIGVNGIEEPRTILLEDDVYGMKCNYQRVELLIQRQNEDFFSRLPFVIREDSIERQKPIPIDYAISEKGPTPIEIEDFHKVMALPLGNWYVQVPGAARPNKVYELHFIRSTEQLRSSFVIDLVEETSDKRVIKSVPLVRVENSEGGE